MAKRKRLTPAQSDYLAAPSPAPAASRAPIAQVAGDAAAASAFHDVADELARAREEGRLVLTLPLEAVEADHLTRDRIAVADDEDMVGLKQSLNTRGQQTPIEVVALSGGTYGLVSGWRRLSALRALHAETGEARFATVQALLRQPDGASAAYVAMVEENEIRANLSFYERARIVRQTVNQGVFDGDQAAVNALFASATHAKRSKIKSFLRVVDGLDGALRFPARLSEHLGLKLSKALAEDAALAPRMAKALAQDPAKDAETEIAKLSALLTAAQARSKTSKADSKPAKSADFEQVIPGLSIKREGKTLSLSGTRVTAGFAKQLEDWLKTLR